MNETGATVFAFMFIAIYLFAMFVFMVMWAMIWMFTIALMVLLLAGLVFWIFMLIDCVQRDEKDFPPTFDNPKNNWTLILGVSFPLGLYWLAAIVYYYMVKQLTA